MGLSGANTTTLSEGAQAAWKAVTKKIPGPVLLGLLGGAAAFTVMGNPGIDDTPIGPPPRTNERISPAVLGATGAGGLTATNRVQPQLESFVNRGGGPSVTGQLSTPVARIAPMVNDISVRTARGDLDRVDYNGLSRALRSVLPHANITSRITDSRRPLMPNDLYRDEF
jgi:hypothetical protein